MLKVVRDLEAIGPAADALLMGLHEILDQEGLACVELAFVEVLTNSILVGSAAMSEPIRVFLDITDTEVVLEIEDGLPPVPELFEAAGPSRLEFDPLDRKNIPETGRGLSLVVISMDEVGYRTVGGHARLRMMRRRT